MNLTGKELHALVFSDANVINPLERVKTVAFANKNDLEAALLHVRGLTNITVIKSQVHIVVPGMANDSNTFASLVTNPKNNSKRIFIQLFKDNEALNNALDVLVNEFDSLNVAAFSKETRVTNYTEFRRSFRETSRVF